MISQRQFTDALTFVRSYKDALECVEQIAERRATYAHYEGLTRTFIEGIQNNHIKLEHGQVKAAAAVADFPPVKMNAFSNSL